MMLKLIRFQVEVAPSRFLPKILRHVSGGKSDKIEDPENDQGGTGPEDAAPANAAENGAHDRADIDAGTDSAHVLPAVTTSARRSTSAWRRSRGGTTGASVLHAAHNHERRVVALKRKVDAKYQSDAE